MADHGGTATVERLFRTLRKRSGTYGVAEGPRLYFQASLSAIASDTCISVNRNTGLALFFGRTPNAPSSKFSASSHPSVSDNLRVLQRGTAYDLIRAELTCLYDGSDEEDTSPTPPLDPVPNRPKRASPPPGSELVTQTRLLTPPRRSAKLSVHRRGGTVWLNSAPVAKSGTLIFVNITDKIVSETPLAVTLLGGNFYRKHHTLLC